MISSINASDLGKNGINFGVVPLDLRVNDGVGVVEESDGVAGGQNVELADLALGGRELVLADHQVLEIVSQRTLLSLVGEDPVEEISVAEGISWESECTLSLNP